MGEPAPSSWRPALGERDRNLQKAVSFQESKGLRVILRRRWRRREGSLAAALAQSMALAVVGTAGAYPSWVLVSGRKTQIVLGAAWAINRVDPAPGTLLLGPDGAPLMLAIAFCCLFSVLSGSLALTLDFLGWRRWRSWAPLLHGITALLIACAAALGSCLLAVIRRRIHTEEELQVDGLSSSPGQSLFLAFLACILAATATGISCMSPALVEPGRSSWDLGRPEEVRFFPSRVRTEEFTDTSGASFLQDRFGLENSSIDDTVSEIAGHFDSRNHLERKLASIERPPEKRRGQQEAAEEERGEGWPQGPLEGENGRLAKGLESEREEKVCSSGT